MNHETWTLVCTVRDIVPNTGVCALVGGEHIAVFRLGDSDDVYAIDNYDPNAEASVLSRGLIGSLGDRLVVASPIYKHHFDLNTGECIEAPEHSVTAYRARVHDGKVWVGTRVEDMGGIAIAANADVTAAEAAAA
jgi:nitrite reductase (NADH) small subunit